MTFIRIGTKSSSSYLKATTQYNHQVLPPLIQMCQVSHLFLISISANILETINWSINVSVSVPAILKNPTSNSSKCTSTSYDNQPILQSMYPILDELNIKTSKLDDKPLDINFFFNYYLKSVVF